MIIISCGEEPKEKEMENIDVEKNPLGALMKMGEKMAESAEKMEEKMKDGENAEAMHYEELLKYLPEKIDGYEISREPEGASIDMAGASYSTAEVKFSNNNDRIQVSILDYNAAYNMYSMATAMWSSGFKIDTSEEFGQSISFGEDINGWESFKKKSGDASVVLGVSDRFLISVEANNQENTDLVKEIIQDMDIKKLSEIE